MSNKIALVTPKTYLIGYTTMDMDGVFAYLRDTGQLAFLQDLETAKTMNIGLGEALCSFYAKLCYASLALGRNDNLSHTRSIDENIRSTLAAGHGSVFEHMTLNFVTANCSRIMTHELVRHRAGTAYSQTSGRYVRTDTLSVVSDPILAGAENEIMSHLRLTQRFYERMEMRFGLRPPDQEYIASREFYAEPAKNFDMKKKLTSALRRFLPNGQANEIGWSVNIRQLRHMFMVRTARGAEWEIRKVFCDLYREIWARFPLMFHDAQTDFDKSGDLFVVKGMVLQPYEQEFKA